MNIKCVIPTRGLIYAETIRGVLSNLRDTTGEDPIFISGRPIPDCFNTGVRTALDAGATHVWFVEEDNEVKPGVLAEMIAQDNSIVTADYPVAKGVSHIHRDSDGEILWCGIGNTLISREVLDDIGYPWFRADMLRNHKTGEFKKLPQHKVDKSFGGHDVLFFTQARRAKHKIIALSPEWSGQHFRASELPKLETNNGCYTINSL